LADSQTRQAKRTPVSLKIKFKSATLAQFIERYSVDVSHGGIFIRTKDPLPVGTTMRFEFQLRDASPLITGEGTVVWTREHDPSRTGVAPGMGVRFDRLTEGSQQVLDKILAQKASKPTSRPDSSGFTDAPTRVAPRPLVNDLAKGSKVDSPGGFDDDRSDTTPLPSPVPFHSDVDEFPEETFEEATKVRSLDELVAASATGDAAAIQSALTRSVEAEEARQAAASTSQDSTPPDQADTAGPAGADHPDEPDRSSTDHPERAATTPFDYGAAAQSGSPDAATDEDDWPTTIAPARETPQTARAPVAPAAAAEEPGKPRHPESQTSAPARAAGKRPVVAVEQEGTDRVGTPSRSRPRQAPARLPGIALALVAAVLLALGGGYLLLAGGKNKNKAAITQAMDADLGQAPDTDSIRDDEIEVEPDEPPVTLVDIEVRSQPSGATATLVGTDQSGPTPVKFQVDESKTHTVRIAQTGFVAQEIDIDPKQPSPEPVALAVAPMVIRVKSAPGGAYVYVDGRRVEGETPVEFVVPDNWRKKRRFKIAVRMIGFDKLDVVVEPDQFQDEGNAMVATVDQPMTEKQTALRRGDGGSGSSGSGSSGSGSSGSGSGGSGSSGSGSGGSGSGGSGSGGSGSGGSDSGSGSGGSDSGSGSGGSDSGSGSGGSDSGSGSGTQASGGTSSSAASGGTSSGAASGGTPEPTPEWAN
jgi:uncharacterized protein (TIGR02266 family)